MKVNQHETSFKAVTIKPTPALWSKKVLNTVLESKYIKNVIEETEKEGKDSFLKYNETLDYSVFQLDSPVKSLRIKSAEGRTISENEASLSEKIKQLDYADEQTRLEYNLEGLKKIASKVLYN